MKILISILFCTLLTSCLSCKGIKKDKIVGKYIGIEEYGIGANIELFSDNTFKYDWYAGLTMGTTFGQWKDENGFLLLNSEKQPSRLITDSYEIIQELKKEAKTITLKVVDNENQPIPFVNCLITTSKGEEKAISSEKGLCEFESNALLENIVLTSIGYKTVEYKPIKVSNDLIIQLRASHESYQFFTNEKWEVKKNKLKYLNKVGDGFVYHKVKT